MKYKQGDLVTLFKQGEFDIIAHQCNCYSVMGGGISGVLCEHFPKMLEIEQRDLNPVLKYGTIQPVFVKEGIIINMFSQFKPGSCTNVGIDSFEVRLGALTNCLKQINKNSGLKIGLTLVASGIAADTLMKKDMSDLHYFGKFIEPIVKQYLPNLDVTIVYL